MSFYFQRKIAPNQSNENDESTNDASDDDGYDDDTRSVLPRRPRGTDNIINIAERNPNIDKTQICYLFIEIAQRTDQSNDFNIAQVRNLL